MTTMMIEDLTVSADLDREAMTSVTGGSHMYRLPLWGGPSYYSRKDVDLTRIDFAADQFIGQEQSVDVVNGANVAFADHIKSVVKPSQNANNNINFR